MGKQKLLGAYVEEDLYEEVRARAFEERCPLSEVVRRALRAYVGQAKTSKASGRRRREEVRS